MVSVVPSIIPILTANAVAVNQVKRKNKSLNNKEKKLKDSPLNNKINCRVFLNNGKVIEGHYEGNWYEDNSDEEGIWIKTDNGIEEINSKDYDRVEYFHKKPLKEAYIKAEKGNIYYTKNDDMFLSMVKSIFISKNIPVRVYYDTIKQMYVFGNAFDYIHADLATGMKYYSKIYGVDEMRANISYLKQNCALFQVLPDDNFKKYDMGDGYSSGWFLKLDDLIFACRSKEYKKVRDNVPLFKDHIGEWMDVQYYEHQKSQQTVNESVEDNVDEKFNSKNNCKIILKDGKIIYGKLLNVNENYIYINSNNGNRIKKNDIKELYMYYDCEVITKNGKTIYGNFVGDFGDHKLHLDDSFNRKGWAIKDEMIDKINYKKVLKKELNEGILGAIAGGLIGKKYKHPYIGAYIGHKIQDKFFNSKNKKDNKEDKINYKKIIYNEIFNDLKNKKITIDTAIDMLIDNKIAKDYDNAIDIVDFWCYEYGLDKSLNESVEEKILYIIRGVPGSGKSTLAHKLTDNVVEADQYFYDDKGNYNWSADKLNQAHNWCFYTVKKYMEEGRDKIAVANTFVKNKDYKRYVELAKEFGYKVDIRTCTGNYQNIHNVPDETVEKMRSKFQETPLDESAENDKTLRDYAVKLANICLDALVKTKYETRISNKQIQINVDKAFKKAVPMLKNSPYEYFIILVSKNDEPNASYGKTVDRKYGLITLPVFSKDPIDQALSILFKHKSMLNKLYSTYSGNELNLKINEYAIKYLKKELEKSLSNVRSEYIDILIHECTHLLDDVRRTKTYKSKEQNLKDDKGIEDYYNSPEEQNAFYQETVSIFDEWVNQSVGYKTFDIFWDDFIRQYRGEYNLLNDKNKRKLKKRAYAYWYVYMKD